MAKLEAAELDPDIDPDGPSSPSSAPLAAQGLPTPAAAAAASQHGSDIAARPDHPSAPGADSEDNEAATARPDGDVALADVKPVAFLDPAERPDPTEGEAGGSIAESELVSSSGSGSGSQDGSDLGGPAAASSTGVGDEDSQDEGGEDEGGEDEEDGDEEGEDEEDEAGEAGSNDGDGEEVAAEQEAPKPRVAQVTFWRFLSCSESSKQSKFTQCNDAISFVH